MDSAVARDVEPLRLKIRNFVETEVLHALLIPGLDRHHAARAAPERSKDSISSEL